MAVIHRVRCGQSHRIFSGAFESREYNQTQQKNTRLLNVANKFKECANPKLLLRGVIRSMRQNAVLADDGTYYMVTWHIHKNMRN
jgi:hypothetical protein